MRILLICIFTFLNLACTTKGQTVATAPKVDIHRFMGDWYVLAGRFTFLEKNVHNGLETYTWNQKRNRIDVGFTFNQDSFTGPVKSIPQKAWIFNSETNAHWKVSPFWPLKFDYLVIAVDDNYQWTAIGVPDQKYLWIMARDWKDAEKTVAAAVRKLTELNYDASNLVKVPHQWPRQ